LLRPEQIIMLRTGAQDCARIHECFGSVGYAYGFGRVT